MQPRRSGVGHDPLSILIRWLTPIRNPSRFTDSYWKELRGEFRVHQGIAETLCVLGLIGGIFLPAAISAPIQIWDIGIGFAAMAALPMAYQAGICGAKGFERTYSRWADYSTMMYAIPWRSTLILYFCMMALGIGCVVGRAFVFLPVSGESENAQQDAEPNRVAE